MKKNITAIIHYSLFIIAAASPLCAQSGSLMGRTTLASPSGRPFSMPDASLIYQPAPQKDVFRVEDIVHVHVKDAWKYNNVANNQRKKKVEAEGRLTYWFDFTSIFSLPGSSKKTLPEIGGEIDHKTQNQGSMQRNQSLDFKIACRVVSVQDNGNLIIQGTHKTRVDEETRIMYLGGIVNPNDIGPGNTIDGTRVTDLEIDNITSGNVTDVIRRPWGTRLVDHWKPF